MLSSKRCLTTSFPFKTFLSHVLLEESWQPILKLYNGLMLVCDTREPTCHLVWRDVTNNVASPNVCCDHVLKWFLTVFTTRSLCYRLLKPMQDTHKTVSSAAMGCIHEGFWVSRASWDLQVVCAMHSLKASANSWSRRCMMIPKAAGTCWQHL